MNDDKPKAEGVPEHYQVIGLDMTISRQLSTDELDSEDTDLYDLVQVIFENAEQLEVFGEESPYLDISIEPLVRKHGNRAIHESSKKYRLIMDAEYFYDFSYALKQIVQLGIDAPKSENDFKKILMLSLVREDKTIAKHLNIINNFTYLKDLFNLLSLLQNQS